MANEKPVITWAQSILDNCRNAVISLNQALSVVANESLDLSYRKFVLASTITLCGGTAQVAYEAKNTFIRMAQGEKDDSAFDHYVVTADLLGAKAGETDRAAERGRLVMARLPADK